MAAGSVYLSNPSVTINSVDLTGQCTAAEVTYAVDSLETTVFGDTAHNFSGGLQNNQITVTLYQSYAAANTEATIFPRVGITTTLVVKPAAGAVSATNPSYTLTGAYLESHTPIAATMGELSTITLTFTGGVLAKATTP